jgi:hypothetical protein
MRPLCYRDNGKEEMRRGRIMTVATVLGALALIAATGAGAATPRQIYADYADNGRLDHHYTKAELQSALNDALIEGYGGASAGAMGSAVQTALSRPTSGALGARHTKLASPAAPLAVATRSTLPFTGFDLALLAVGGGVLLLVGGGLRHAGHRA